MNKIEKSKRALIIFGIILAVFTILCFVFGVMLLVADFHPVRLVFGILLLLLGIFLALLSIYFIWVGASQVATEGNLKQDNIANRGTINARLCSKCGNELPAGADFCPKCGQTASSCKVCECGAENNMENKKCISCGKDLD